ncbi:hypothetical protein B0H13DRAFT_1864517 [Mycena leptocephala]|nr:hypothetical protein B0H13DRAFT_1864517 [Mycena leptocephala]
MDTAISQARCDEGVSRIRGARTPIGVLYVSYVVEVRLLTHSKDSGPIVEHEYEVPPDGKDILKCFGGCDEPIIGVPRICCTFEGRRRRWHLKCWKLSEINIREEPVSQRGRTSMKCYGGCGFPPRMCWLIGNDKQRWHVDCWNLFQNEVWGSHDINSTNSPAISVNSNTDISAIGGKTYRDVGLQIPDAPSKLKTYCDEGVQAPGLTSPRVHLTSIDECDDSNLAAIDVDVEISEGV